MTNASLVKDSSQLKGIGGWLLCYVIWTACSIAIAIGINVYDICENWGNWGEYRVALASLSCLVCAWYSFYGWVLWQVCKLKPGVIPKIMFMIIATPVFNLFMPGIYAAFLALAIPGSTFYGLLGTAYDAQTAMTFIGALLIAMAWFAYFKRSRRIENTWPSQ